MTYEVLVVGCGLSGVTIAEQFATRLNKKVLIIDKRNHIGGNVYDYVDKETGILMNEYGAHVFHTNSDRVWTYVNQFSKWERWDHEIMGLVDGRYVHIPVNITTVNTLCGQNIRPTNISNRHLTTKKIESSKNESISTNNHLLGKCLILGVLY